MGVTESNCSALYFGKNDPELPFAMVRAVRALNTLIGFVFSFLGLWLLKASCDSLTAWKVLLEKKLGINLICMFLFQDVFVIPNTLPLAVVCAVLQVCMCPARYIGGVCLYSKV